MLANGYHQGPITDHFDGTRFFNPGQLTTDRSLADPLFLWPEGTRSRGVVLLSLRCPDARENHQITSTQGG